jgi:hypothetical protein
VQKVALRAVAEGWRDDPRTPVWLRHRAVNDSHSWARELAVQELTEGWRDDPKTVAWLRDRAVNDSNSTVRRVAEGGGAGR